MIINVGTNNGSKLRALLEIIQEYEFLHGSEIKSLPVFSDVSAQPLTREETQRGAYNRARNSFCDCDYSVGIESGLMPFFMESRVGFGVECGNEVRQSRFMELTICCIYDGKHDFYGYSPAFECPAVLVNLIFQKGLTLSEAAVRGGFTDNPFLGQAEGIVGVLSKNHLNRTEYTKMAIRTALFALQNPDFYTL